VFLRHEDGAGVSGYRGRAAAEATGD
jgi:hypothetical protein